MNEITFIEKFEGIGKLQVSSEFILTPDFTKEIEAVYTELNDLFKNNRKNFKILNTLPNQTDTNILIAYAGACRYGTTHVYIRSVRDLRPFPTDIVEARNFVDYEQDKILINQKKALDIFRNGRVPKAADFINKIEDTSKGTVNCRIMYSARLRAGVVCDECGAIVTKAAYTSHSSSFNCIADHLAKNVINKGWVQADPTRDIQSIRKSNVPHEVVPSGFTIWTPDWVQDAIKTYRENKGYANLTLAEYLNKINDSRPK